MNYNYEGEKFLSKLDSDLHMKKSVIHSSNENDENLEKIKKYLDREERIHNKAVEDNKLDLLKQAYFDKYVIKDIPQSHIDYLDKQAFDKTGHHLDIEKLEEYKRIIIDDQKRSLSVWIDYLTSEDAKFYPWWTKYWAFKGMLSIGVYDSDKEDYEKRDDDTVEPFIELNVESFTKSIDLILKEVHNEPIDDNTLEDMIKSGSFAKLYLALLKQKKEKLYNEQDIEGVWIKYDQKDDYKSLYESLQGYNTCWSFASEAMCKSQLKNGDFYIYYTKDNNEDYKVPRLAIRMDNKTRIDEIIGVGQNQNIEPHLEGVLDKKLDEFGDKEIYKKRINNVKMLTYIYTKYELNKELTKDDLKFIYEVDGKITLFGYKEDPRMIEIRENRNLADDLKTMFDFKEKMEGDLNLRFITNAKGIVFPKEVEGNLVLSFLESAEDVVLPKKVGKVLDLSRLKTTKGLVLPEEIGEYLDLAYVTSAIGLKFPEKINYTLYLDGLTTTEGLVLPKEINGSLYLDRLENAKGLVLPEKISGDLSMEGLTSAKDLVLPKEIGNSLILNGLENVDYLDLSHSKIGDLVLSKELEANMKTKNYYK